MGVRILGFPIFEVTVSELFNAYVQISAIKRTPGIPHKTEKNENHLLLSKP